ncbi:hypothetical protein [Lysobacter gummosus]|uniref:hypothetical protein n=1 Tax=Lysobacter gummosus TaxID=262324 RepID=UPI0036349CA3
MRTRPSTWTMSWSKTRRSNRREGAVRAISLRGRGRLAAPAGSIPKTEQRLARCSVFVLNPVRLTY